MSLTLLATESVYFIQKAVGNHCWVEIEKWHCPVYVLKSSGWYRGENVWRHAWEESRSRESGETTGKLLQLSRPDEGMVEVMERHRWSWCGFWRLHWGDLEVDWVRGSDWMTPSFWMTPKIFGQLSGAICFKRGEQNEDSVQICSFWCD